MANIKKKISALLIATGTGGKDSGYTLIELIVATALIAVVILGLYLVFVLGIKINTRARHLTLAYQIANQEIEILRNTPFAQLPADQTDGPFYGDIAGLDELPSGEGFLTINDYGDDNKIKEALVRITWLETGSAREINQSTLITLGGINP